MLSATPTYLYDSAKLLAQIDEDSADSEEDRLTLRKYVENLLENGLPALISDRYVSSLLGFRIELLYRISNSSDKFYRRFKIPKSTGGIREICEPLPALKLIQRTILTEIVEKLPVYIAAHAYRTGYSIKRNARIHSRQPYLLKMDIRNFFPSIHVGRVHKIFFDAGYTSQVSAILASLCTDRGGLPQSAPTSAAISNVVMYPFDENMLKYCRNRNLRYTRYTDDISISGEYIYKEDIIFVSNIIYNDGFQVNKEKTKKFGPGCAKIVTGVLINNRLRAPAKQRSLLRQEMHYVDTLGIWAHAERKKQSPLYCLRRLRGQSSFMSWLDPKDQEIKYYINILNNIRVD